LYSATIYIFFVSGTLKKFRKADIRFICMKQLDPCWMRIYKCLQYLVLLILSRKFNFG